MQEVFDKIELAVANGWTLTDIEHVIGIPRNCLSSMIALRKPMPLKYQLGIIGYDFGSNYTIRKFCKENNCQPKDLMEAYKKVKGIV